MFHDVFGAKSLKLVGNSLNELLFIVEQRSKRQHNHAVVDVPLDTQKKVPSYPAVLALHA